MRNTHGGEGDKHVMVHGVLDETRDEHHLGDEVGWGTMSNTRTTNTVSVQWGYRVMR
jgi:hypothetical protein